jgi:hypothetical protein
MDLDVKGRPMPANTLENDDRLTPHADALERPMYLRAERGRARAVRPLPHDLIRTMARELPLYRRHVHRTLPAQVQRSAFAMYSRQVEILRDRIRARKRNPILYTESDFERQLRAVREFRRRFEALAQAA